MSKRSPMRPKHRPRPVRPSLDYPGSALNFAILGEMVTDEEVEAIENLDMSISHRRIFNANYDHPTMPTGTYQDLYHGRKWDQMVDRILKTNEGPE